MTRPGSSRWWTAAPLVGLVPGLLLAGVLWWPGCRPPSINSVVLVTGVVTMGLSVALWRIFRWLHAEGRSVAAFVAAALMNLGAGVLVLGWWATNLAGSAARGVQKRAMGDIRTISLALEQYRVAHGSYPVER